MDNPNLNCVTWAKAHQGGKVRYGVLAGSLVALVQKSAERCGEKIAGKLDGMSP